VLRLTPEASRAVLDLVVARDLSAGAGLRISPGPRSTFEPTWDYAVEPAPRPGDLIVEAGRTRVFVDPDAAPQLEHALLDARVDPNTLETHFVVRVN
jgi:Fe-S cluster assembly iron-binding protein IscA